MTVSDRTIEFGESRYLSSIWVVKFLQSLPSHHRVDWLMACLKWGFLLSHSFSLHGDTHQLIFPLIACLDWRQNAIGPELCLSFVFLYCHQILVHLVDFVCRAIKTIEIGADLGLRRHAVVDRYSHLHLVVAKLEGVSLAWPVEWLCVKPWLFCEQFVCLPIINLFVSILLLVYLFVILLLNLESFVVRIGFLNRYWNFILLRRAIFKPKIILRRSMKLIRVQQLLYWSSIKILLWQIFRKILTRSNSWPCWVVPCNFIHFKVIKVLFEITLKTKISISTLR